MFNLEQAIAGWRRKMESSGIESAEVLDELESHLRDDVEEQMHSGVKAERAFGSAVARMGTARELKQELAKSGRQTEGSRRGFWLGFYFLCATLGILIDLWSLISFELSAPERVAGACAVACLGLYLLVLPFLPWSRGSISHPRLLGMIKAMGILVPLWTLWALLTAIRVIHVELGLIPAMVMWSLCLAYGLTGLALGCNRDTRDGGWGGWLQSDYPVPTPIPPRSAVSTWG